MFRCQLTGELSGDREAPVALVIQKRERIYKNRFTRNEELHETTSKGWEIEKVLYVRASNVDKAKKKYGLE